MTEYRRAKAEGATYLFTVNCAERGGNHLLTRHIDLLRQAFRRVKNGHPFSMTTWRLESDPIDAVRRLTASYVLLRFANVARAQVAFLTGLTGFHRIYILYLYSLNVLTEVYQQDPSVLAADRYLTNPGSNLC
jgi:hypothetical protein